MSMRMQYLTCVLFVCLGLALSVVACGGGDDSGRRFAPPPPSTPADISDIEVVGIWEGMIGIERTSERTPFCVDVELAGADDLVAAVYVGGQRQAGELSGAFPETTTLELAGAESQLHAILQPGQMVGSWSMTDGEAVPTGGSFWAIPGDAEGC